MMMPLERPVLSLTIDAVVEMTGEDALCGLLTRTSHSCVYIVVILLKLLTHLFVC